MVKKGSYPRSPPPPPLPPLERALDRAPRRVVGRARTQAPRHACGRVGVGRAGALEAQRAAKRRAVVAVKRLAHLAVLGRLQIDPKLRMDTASSLVRFGVFMVEKGVTPGSPRRPSYPPRAAACRHRSRRGTPCCPICGKQATFCEDDEDAGWRCSEGWDRCSHSAAQEVWRTTKPAARRVWAGTYPRESHRPS
jgi:hypothetical protein